LHTIHSDLNGNAGEWTNSDDSAIAACDRKDCQRSHYHKLITPGAMQRIMKARAEKKAAEEVVKKPVPAKPSELVLCTEVVCMKKTHYHVAKNDQKYTSRCTSDNTCMCSNCVARTIREQDYNIPLENTSLIQVRELGEAPEPPKIDEEESKEDSKQPTGSTEIEISIAIPSNNILGKPSDKTATTTTEKQLAATWVDREFQPVTDDLKEQDIVTQIEDHLTRLDVMQVVDNCPQLPPKTDERPHPYDILNLGMTIKQIPDDPDPIDLLQLGLRVPRRDYIGPINDSGGLERTILLVNPGLSKQRNRSFTTIISNCLHAISDGILMKWEPYSTLPREHLMQIHPMLTQRVINTKLMTPNILGRILLAGHKARNTERNALNLEDIFKGWRYGVISRPFVDAYLERVVTKRMLGQQGGVISWRPIDVFNSLERLALTTPAFPSTNSVLFINSYTFCINCLTLKDQLITSSNAPLK
jgi:hypothetical protein